MKKYYIDLALTEKQARELMEVAFKEVPSSHRGDYSPVFSIELASKIYSSVLYELEDWGVLDETR